MSLQFQEHSHEIAAATAKAAVAVAGATYAGLTASDIAAWLTALYVTLQIFLILPKIRERIMSYWTKFKEWRK